jgi:hypothetical protein
LFPDKTSEPFPYQVSAFPGGGPGAINVNKLYFNSFQGNENLYINKGNHSIKVGGSVERMQYNFDIPNLNGGSFSFGSLSTYLTNKPSSFGALYPGSDTIRGLRTDADRRLHPGRLSTQKQPHAEHRHALRIPDHTHRGQRKDCAAALPVRHHCHSWRTGSGPKSHQEKFCAAGWPGLGSHKVGQDVGPGRFRYLRLATAGLVVRHTIDSFDALFRAGCDDGASCRFVSFRRVSLLQVNDLRTAYIEPKPGRAYSMKWNLNIQKEIHGWVADIGYTGSRGVSFAASGAQHEHRYSRASSPMGHGFIRPASQS